MGGVPALLARAGLPPGIAAGLVSEPSTKLPPESSAWMCDWTGRPFVLKVQAHVQGRVAPSGTVQVVPAGLVPLSWIGFDLQGKKVPDQLEWSNRSGIGSTVEVRCGNQVALRQLSSAGTGVASGPPRLYFDLGGARKIDYVRILWPDGVLQSELGLAANWMYWIEEVQRKPTSCPIVFAWDGTRYQYVADLLGVGGLGYLETPGVFESPL